MSFFRNRPDDKYSGLRAARSLLLLCYSAVLAVDKTQTMCTRVTVAVILLNSIYKRRWRAGWAPRLEVADPVLEGQPGPWKGALPALQALCEHPHTRLSAGLPHPAGGLQCRLAAAQAPLAHSSWCRESCSPRELKSQGCVQYPLCICNVEGLPFRI